MLILAIAGLAALLAALCLFINDLRYGEADIASLRTWLTAIGAILGGIAFFVGMAPYFMAF